MQFAFLVPAIFQRDNALKTMSVVYNVPSYPAMRRFLQRDVLVCQHHDKVGQLSGLWREFVIAQNRACARLHALNRKESSPPKMCANPL